MSLPTSSLLVAVDGGGTGCRAAVGTLADGILAQAKGGPANVSNDFDGAIANIRLAVETAATRAGLPVDSLALATARLGLAGADLETTQDKTQNALPYGQSRVSGDRQTTVAGVLGGQDGYVLALGTGTIIASQKADAVETVSGWGFHLSDQASGAWLGRALLSLVLDAEENLCPHSDLTRDAAAAMEGVQGIFAFSHIATPGDYAAYAPQIFAAGQAGDAVALDLLTQGAAYLQRGLDVLDFAESDTLSLAGGVGPHYAPYLAARYTQNLIAPRGNALDGAFALARQLATP